MLMQILGGEQGVLYALWRIKSEFTFFQSLGLYRDYSYPFTLSKEGHPSPTPRR